MAVQDDSKFDRWNAARQNLEQRRQFHDVVVSKYPPNHSLVKDVKSKLAAAQEEYDKAVSEL